MTPDEWFNQALNDYVDGKMAAGRLFDLGPAGDFGFKGWLPARILMTQKVMGHIAQKHNEVGFVALQNLPSRLRRPVMIFKSRTESNAYVIATDLVVAGAPLVAAIHQRETRNFGCYNDVRSLHPRPLADLRRWIDEGLVRYENKDLARVWLQDSAPCN